MPFAAVSQNQHLFGYDSAKVYSCVNEYGFNGASFDFYSDSTFVFVLCRDTAACLCIHGQWSYSNHRIILSEKSRNFRCVHAIDAWFNPFEKKFDDTLSLFAESRYGQIDTIAHFRKERYIFIPKFIGYRYKVLVNANWIDGPMWNDNPYQQYVGHKYNIRFKNMGRVESAYRWIKLGFHPRISRSHIINILVLEYAKEQDMYRIVRDNPFNPKFYWCHCYDN
jgi:hypothetical protein